MRILVICRWGCNHEVRYMFHRWWKQHGAEVYVLALHESYQKSARECDDDRMPPFATFPKWEYEVCPSLAVVEQAIAGFKPDVVYVGGEPYIGGAFELASLIRSRKLPQVWAVSQNLFIENSSNDVERRTLPLVDGYLCCSSSVNDRYKNAEIRFGIAEAPKLWGGVGSINDEVFTFRSSAQKVALRRAIIPEYADKCVFGFAGRIVPEKGIGVAIQALAGLPEPAKSRCVLLVAGDRRPYQAEAEALASSLGVSDKVRFVGHVRTRRMLADWLACLDVFLFPSCIIPNWIEQLGLAPIEAGMVGTPAIVSKCGGLLNVVNCESTGRFCVPGSVDSLKDEMEWMLSHPRQREEMGREASAYLTEKYGSAEADRQFDFLKYIVNRS